MHSTIRSISRSSVLDNLRSSRVVTRHPAVLIALVLVGALVAATFGGSNAGAASSSFATQQTFGTGADPRAVAAGDVNGDGLPDLVIANQGENTVSVLLNTTTPGSSTFTFGAKVDFSTGGGPQWVVLGDINGDSMLDIAVAN